MANKAVSAILFPRLRSGHALHTFFLVVQKESVKDCFVWVSVPVKINCVIAMTAFCIEIRIFQ